MVYSGQSQTKMDDDWGYLHFRYPPYQPQWESSGIKNMEDAISTYKVVWYLKKNLMWESTELRFSPVHAVETKTQVIGEGQEQQSQTFGLAVLALSGGGPTAMWALGSLGNKNG